MVISSYVCTIITSKIPSLHLTSKRSINAAANVISKHCSYANFLINLDFAATVFIDIFINNCATFESNFNWFRICASRNNPAVTRINNFFAISLISEALRKDNNSLAFIISKTASSPKFIFHSFSVSPTFSRNHFHCKFVSTINGWFTISSSNINKIIKSSFIPICHNKTVSNRKLTNRSFKGCGNLLINKVIHTFHDNSSDFSEINTTIKEFFKTNLSSSADCTGADFKSFFTRSKLKDFIDTSKANASYKLFCASF